MNREPSGRTVPREDGAATVLVLAVVGLVCFVVGSLAASVGLVRSQRVAQSAADLAALAGATALVEGAAGCEAAREVAGANGTELTACMATSGQVRVTVQVAGARWLGREVDVVAEARAGPA